MGKTIDIRECTTLEEFGACTDLQRRVFALPDIEVSPVRHLVVTRSAGGFVLGAFDGAMLVGFVLSVPAFMRGQDAFYSHMTGVLGEYQGHNIGSRLKWAQREQALSRGIKFIKWTFEPVKARNAYFNLEKLGAIVTEYQEDYYGTDYSTAPEQNGERVGLASDRLFAEWHLESDKVRALGEGRQFVEPAEPAATIEIMNDFPSLVAENPSAALAEQLRVRGEFFETLSLGLVVRGFRRDPERPAYLLYGNR